MGKFGLMKRMSASRRALHVDFFAEHPEPVNCFSYSFVKYYRVVLNERGVTESLSSRRM